MNRSSDSVPWQRALADAERADELVGGRYELLRRLGHGAMGVVHSARDRLLDEVIALKLLHDHAAGHPRVLDSLRQEAKLSRRISHPNVARVHDLGEHRGRPFLTMELVAGEPLSRLIAREAPLPETRVMALGAAIADGLDAAHRAGVIHRDLKPDNVLVSRDGRVVITDFGVARALEAGGTGTGATVGTPMYMAPEQLDSPGDIDPRADLYALGVLLYELVVGRTPWPRGSFTELASARLLKSPPDPRRHAPVSDRLASAIVRCLARSPEERFASAATLASTLRDDAAEAETIAIASGHLRDLAAAAPEAARLLITTTSDDPILAGLSALLAEATEDASTLASVQLAPAQPMAEARARGASLMAELRLDSVDERLAARLSLRDPASGRELEVAVSERPAGDLAGLLTALVATCARRLGRAPVASSVRAPASGTAALALLRARGLELRGHVGDADAAIAAYESALRACSFPSPMIDSGYARALLARFARGEGLADELAEAAALARRALADAGDPGIAREALATALIEQGAYEAAARELGGPRPDRNRPAGAARAAIDQLWLVAGQPELALADPPGTADPGQSHHRLVRARALAHAGNLQQALAAVEAATAENDSTWLAWLERARLLHWLGDQRAGARLVREVSEVPMARHDDVLVIAGSLVGLAAPVEARRRLAELADEHEGAAQRIAGLFALNTEVALLAGDEAGATRLLADPRLEAVELGWLHASPVRLLRDRAPYRALAARLRARGERIRKLLEDEE